MFKWLIDDWKVTTKQWFDKSQPANEPLDTAIQ